MVRHTYAEVHERARLCALALRRLGVREGDRVATIAWNTCRHLESWSVLCYTMSAIPYRHRRTKLSLLLVISHPSLEQHT